MESLEVLPTWDEDRHQPETSVTESLVSGIQRSQPDSRWRWWIARLSRSQASIDLIRLRVGVIPCVSSLIESEAIQGRLIPPDRACVIPPRGAFLIMTDDHDHKRLEDQWRIKSIWSIWLSWSAYVFVWDSTVVCVGSFGIDGRSSRGIGKGTKPLRPDPSTTMRWDEIDGILLWFYR